MKQSNKDWTSYSTNFNSQDQKNTYYGITRFSEKNMKKFKNKKFRIVNKKRFATATIVAATMAIYSGVSLVQDVTNLTQKAITKTSNAIEEVKAYNQKVAYTNYTDEEIKNMDYEEKLALYKEYIEYVQENAMPIEHPVKDDYNIMKADADATAYEVSQYTAIDADMLKREQDKVLGKYKETINVINSIYSNKYSLNSQDPDVKIIHQIHEMNNYNL